eukprot:4124472-Pyramimonas_sp.AAC.1
MVRNRARPDHHRPAPLPSSKRGCEARPTASPKAARSQFCCTVVAIVPEVGDRRGSDGPCQANMLSVSMAS